MDRRIVYAGQIPVTDDLLRTNREAMVGVSRLAEAILGLNNVKVTGLVMTTNTGDPFAVDVSMGQIYASGNVDVNSYGDLAADTRVVLKQGYFENVQTFSTPAPVGAGTRIVYNVEVAFQEPDDEFTTLLYYNVDDPDTPWPGPGGGGAQQATMRKGICDVKLTAGVAAATGTEVPPATTPGYTVLWEIRVANDDPSVGPAPPGSNGSASGFWEIGSSHRIKIGAGSGILEEDADLKYAQLAASNTFTQSQLINQATKYGMTLQGGPVAPGTGIALRLESNDGAATPGKTIASEGGSLKVRDHADSTTLMTLDDLGNAFFLGVVKGDDPIADEDFVTKSFGDANYAGGGVPPGTYVEIDPVGQARQIVDGPLEASVQTPETTLNANELVTWGYVEGTYAKLSAGGGIDKSQADNLYVRSSGNGNQAPQDVSHTVDFTGTLRHNGDDVATEIWADGRFAREDQTVNFQSITVNSQGSGADAVMHRGGIEGQFMQLNGNDNGLISGAFNFTNATVTVPTSGAGSGQEVANIDKVAQMIAGGGAGSAALTDASNNFLFPHLQNFQGPIQINDITSANAIGTPTSGNNLVNKSYVDITFVKVGENINLPVGPKTGNQAVSAADLAGIGGAALEPVGSSQTFLNNNTFNEGVTVGAAPASGPSFLSIGSGYGFTLNGAVLDVRAGAQVVAQFSPFGFNTTGGRDITAGGKVSGATGSFTGAVTVGQGTKNTNHAVRHNDYGGAFGGTSGHCIFPNGFRLQWTRANTGTPNVFGVSQTTVSFGGFSQTFSVQVTVDGSGAAVAAMTVGASSLSTSSFSLNAGGSGNTGPLGCWILIMGLD